MSLIPSESLNFPDSFRAKVGWHLEDPNDSPTSASEQLPLVERDVAKQLENAENKTGSPPPEIIPTTAAAVGTPTPSNSADDNDQQLEFPPASPAGSTASADSGVAGMNALLQHFLASAAASATPSEPSNGETNASFTDPAGDSAVNHPTLFIGPEEPLAHFVSVPNDFKLSNVVNDTVDASEVKVGSAPEPAPTEQLPIAAEAPAAVAAEPFAEAASLEPAAPAGAVAIETPAQAQHIMQLIAAAVQRGAIAGGPVPEAPQPPRAPAAVPKQEAEIIPEAPQPAPVLSSAAVTEAAQPPDAPPSAPVTTPTTEVAKGPAKIRITPRKIKPRPVEPPAQPPIDMSPADPFPAEQSPARPEPIPQAPRSREPLRFAATANEPPSPELIEEPISHAETFSRKMASARLHYAQADLLRFTATERRNRWLGFILSEGAVLTALILLGRFGFTHKFPDPTVKLLVFILIFAAAAVAVALPIAFFRNSPQRWANQR